MKKIIGLILIAICFMCTSCVSNIKVKNDGDEVLAYEDIYDKIIRFHVIANSDSKEDQELKLKVRDKVIDFMLPKVKNAKSLDEARDILKANIDEVNKLAVKIIKENSYDYSVDTMLSYENFPVKIYGDVAFPEGEYEAYRIVIGSGQGQNWWCVMFPPLCFVDETKSNVNTDELKEGIKEDISEDLSKIVDEDIIIDNGNKSDLEDVESGEDKVVFKFKIWEKLKGLFE